MAPNGWVDGFNNAVGRVSDELRNSNGYSFEVSFGRSEPALAPWVIAVIALVAVAVLVCLVVACCRCCCRSERGRVLIVPQPVAPQPQVVTQYMPGHYPVSPTPLMMQPPGAATHGAGAGVYSDKSSRAPPPAYDQEVLVQLNESHKFNYFK